MSPETLEAAKWQLEHGDLAGLLLLPEPPNDSYDWHRFISIMQDYDELGKVVWAVEGKKDHRDSGDWLGVVRGQDIHCFSYWKLLIPHDRIPQ